MEAAGDKPGKDIPKDDAAKERMKAEQEMRDAKLAFVECASLSRFPSPTLLSSRLADEPLLLSQMAARTSWTHTGASCVSFLPLSLSRSPSRRAEPTAHLLLAGSSLLAPS